MKKGAWRGSWFPTMMGGFSEDWKPHWGVGDERERSMQLVPDRKETIESCVGD